MLVNTDTAGQSTENSCLWSAEEQTRHPLHTHSPRLRDDQERRTGRLHELELGKDKSKTVYSGHDRTIAFVLKGAPTPAVHR